MISLLYHNSKSLPITTFDNYYFFVPHSRMEFQEVTGVPIKIWQDAIMNASFVDILTDTTILSAKLPSTIDQYKLGHMINPEYLLDIELVKTRKNWIIKHLAICRKMVHLTQYNEHVLYATMIKTISQFSHVDQQTNALAVLILFLQQPLSTISMSTFEAAILDSEGFLEKNKNKPLETRVKIGKSLNHLIDTKDY